MGKRQANPLRPATSMCHLERHPLRTWKCIKSPNGQSLIATPLKDRALPSPSSRFLFVSQWRGVCAVFFCWFVTKLPQGGTFFCVKFVFGFVFAVLALRVAERRRELSHLRSKKKKKRHKEEKNMNSVLRTTPTTLPKKTETKKKGKCRSSWQQRNAAAQTCRWRVRRLFVANERPLKRNRRSLKAHGSSERNEGFP